MRDCLEGANQLVLSGEVVSQPQLRTSPAGIEISRFILKHQSVQQEAGSARKVSCRIQVVACGVVARPLPSPGFQLCISGFLSYESRQQDDARLVLHAQNIERTE